MEHGNPPQIHRPHRLPNAGGPGAISWLGGGGGWGERGMGFGSSVNWDCFANMNLYTNWQGQLTTYEDFPPDLSKDNDAVKQSKTQKDEKEKKEKKKDGKKGEHPGKNKHETKGKNEGDSEHDSATDVGFKINDAVDKTTTLTSGSIYGAQKLVGTATEDMAKLTTLSVLGRVTGGLSIYYNSKTFFQNPQENWWNGVEAVGQFAAIAIGYATGIEEIELIYNVSTLTIDMGRMTMEKYKQEHP